MGRPVGKEDEVRYGWCWEGALTVYLKGCMLSDDSSPDLCNTNMQ